MGDSWAPRGRATDFMQGLAKGLAVIRTFSDADPVLSASAIAARTGMDRAAARRCLLTLESLGYVRKDGRNFALTSKVLALGHDALRAQSLPQHVQPHLDAIARETGAVAAVATLDGAEVRYVARSTAQGLLSVSLTAGSRLPAHCSAAGRVLLAALPMNQAITLLEESELEALTPHTKADRTELVTTLAQSASQGYAVVDQELEIGLCAIAVPLWDAAGMVVAALEIVAPVARVPAASLTGEHLALLRGVQRDMTAAMAASA